MRPHRPSSPGRHLITVLWRTPLIAVPIAAFIWFRDTTKWSEFFRYYVPTLGVVFGGDWACGPGSIWSTHDS